ncbi:MAG: aminopeptidase [Gammaproteobacteria bacterium]
MYTPTRPDTTSGWRGGRRALCVLMMAGLLTGCASAGFYMQAVAGQLNMWRREQPIERLLAESSLDERTRARLVLVEEIRTFAEHTLALPAAGSYRNYADLERDHVVWNVFAAPEFEFEPHRSCFFVAGCLDYRGFFRRGHAERYAAELRARGYDTFVGGVAAYSTLGWFDDPVLNTFLFWPERELAGIVFHELAHQRLYVADDTKFNESYATAVAEAGLERWYEHRYGTAAPVLAARRRERAVLALIEHTREALRELYASDLDDTAKRDAKRTLFEALETAYAALRRERTSKPDTTGFGKTPWNNARISAVATYHDHVDAFHALLAACANDFTAFHRAAVAIGDLEPDARRARLRALDDHEGETSCPDRDVKETG